MTLTEIMMEKLVTPKPGKHTTKLPGKSARTNAQLIASVVARKMGEGRK